MAEVVAAWVVTRDAGELGGPVDEDEDEFDSVEQEGHLGLDLDSAANLAVVDLAAKHEPGADASEVVVVGTEHALEPGVRTRWEDAYA